MVRSLDNVEAGARAEVAALGTQQIEMGKLVAGALQKQHGDAHAREVFGAFRAGPALSLIHI